MFITESFLLKFFSVFVATFVLIIIWYKRRYSQWKNLGLEYIEPTIPLGNVGDVIRQKTALGDWYADFYLQMKAHKLRHAGVYFLHLPAYVPLDLDLIKRIMQTDFVHFTDHGGYINEKDDPLSANIFALGGQKWRQLRVKLTPTFTSGKMKMMFPIMVKISNELGKTLAEESKNGVPIDLKDISARFTTDVIGNCAFGIDCNSLKDPNTEFRVQGNRLFQSTPIEMLTTFLCVLFPNIMKFLGVRIFPKEASDFFWNVIKETVEYRTKNGVRRDDAMQLLIDMMGKEGEDNTDSLTFSELAAQALLFFAGGFETSSTLMSFALLELSRNQEMQDRLREEIYRVLGGNNGEMTYETLNDMHYLDMVISETLRKYPPLSLLSRECTKDYRVPDSEIVLHKGDIVFISVKGIHSDPEYYPEPEKFDPTRFTEENKSKRHQFAYIPFGEGPRMCLGLRFGLMQAKVGLTLLIRDFRFKMNPQTVYPVVLDPKYFMTAAKGGLWTDIERIDECCFNKTSDNSLAKPPFY